VVVGLLAGVTAACGGGGPTRRAEVGQPAPLFSTFDVDGRPVSLSSFKGRPVLVNFWASWCVPCRAEFPVLRKAIETHPGLVVLGVVFQDGRGPAAAFLRDQHATWPGLIDPKGQIAKAYGVAAKPGIPVTVAIGADGIVRSRHLGPLPQDADLDALLTGPG
jgi:cytochrome c biogenesis protein CcmG, thiol:disulfide interchange protein DsbE